MPTLFQLEGSAVVRVFPLQNGMVTIGRGNRNDVVLTDSEISRKHCRLTMSAGLTWLEDLQSRNGTWIWDTAIKSPTPLRDNDRICLGQTVFVFRQEAVSRTVIDSTLIAPAVPAPRSLSDCHQEFRIRIRWRINWNGFSIGWWIHRV